MKKTMKRNVVLSAFLSIFLCLSIITGATFALFTSESKVNVAVTSGKVEVVATAEDFNMTSLNDINVGTYNEYVVESNTVSFNKVVPGDKLTFNIRVKNNSNVLIKYRTIISCENDNGLFAGLVVKINDNVFNSTTSVVDKWAELEVGSNDMVIPVSIELPIVSNEIDNLYQDKTCTISYKVEAVQGNARTVDDASVEDVATAESFTNLISNSATDASKEVLIGLPSNSTAVLENNAANGNNARNITFVGDGTQTVDVITESVSAEGGQLSYQRGSTFGFENMTIEAGTGNFDGIVCDELTFTNCTIKGKLTLYGKATFVDCTFENDMADQYSIWTWGGTEVVIDNCTFNTNGKAILLYGNSSASNPTKLTVNNCKFYDNNNGTVGKAVIEVGNDYGATYYLTATNNKIYGYAINVKGTNTGTKMYGNKNSMDSEHLFVTLSNNIEY